MEDTSKLINNLLHEIPSTAIGFTSLLCAIIVKNSIYINYFFDITWAERIIIFLALSYVLGKIFSYIGYFVLLAISAVIHIKDTFSNLKILLDRLYVLKISSKSLSVFNRNLITQSKVYRYIGENPSVQKVFNERMASSTFCLSLLGSVITAPLYIHRDLIYQNEFKLFIVFCILLGINSLIQKENFYGHCVKDFDEDMLTKNN